MKKLWIGSAILFSGSSLAPSIALGQATTRFGVKAGINYSKLGAHNLAGSEWLVGVVGGAFAQIPLSPDGFFLFQPELLYSGKGGKYIMGGQTYTQRLHYLDLPLLGKINAHGFTFEAGPQASYLMASREETWFGVSSELSNYQRLTIGAVAGVGYQTPVGLSLTIRYAGDLGNAGGKQSGMPQKSSVYQFQLGYILGGK